MWGSIPITITEAGLFHAGGRGYPRPAFRLPVAWFGDGPLLSQAANGDRGEDRTFFEPTLRPDGRQEAPRAIPTVTYGTLQTRQFEHETADPYKSEADEFGPRDRDAEGPLSSFWLIRWENRRHRERIR